LFGELAGANFAVVGVLARFGLKLVEANSGCVDGLIVSFGELVSANFATVDVLERFGLKLVEANFSCVDGDLGTFGL